MDRIEAGLAHRFACGIGSEVTAEVHHRHRPGYDELRLGLRFHRGRFATGRATNTPATSRRQHGRSTNITGVVLFPRRWRFEWKARLALGDGAHPIASANSRDVDRRKLRSERSAPPNRGSPTRESIAAHRSYHGKLPRRSKRSRQSPQRSAIWSILSPRGWTGFQTRRLPSKVSY